MTIVDEFRRDDARVLDRLVDGELSQDQRRELLAALDDEPGAWRRCALVFLEAQSWRWQLGQVAAEPIVAQLAATKSAEKSPLPRATRGTFWSACLAIAASLLVAFGLGTRFPLTSEQPIAVKQASDAAPVTDAVEAARVEPAKELSPATEGESPWETLTLTLADATGGSDPRDKFEVRARGVDTDEGSLEKLLAGEDSTLASALIQRLEDEGWKVTRERHFLPVDLSDGRRMVVPVEQVDVRTPEVTKF